MLRLNRSEVLGALPAFWAIRTARHPEDTGSSEVKISEGFATGGTGGPSGDVVDTKSSVAKG